MDELLDCLLSAAAEDSENSSVETQNDSSTTKTDTTPACLKAIDIFDGSNTENNDTPIESDSVKNKKNSVIHNGDTDSSDDEQNRDYENAKYNEFGKDVKHMLASSSLELSSKSFYNTSSSAVWKAQSKNVNELSLASKPASVARDVYTDPVFGMRIVKPLISSTVLQERMVGREAVPMPRIKFFLKNLNKDKDWVVAGAIVRKTAGKTSAKGNQFSVWTLSDLHGEIKTVSIFLFGNAHKELWKLNQGTVVGILNPSVLENKNNSEEAALSVDNPQRVMIIGQSKDLGTCKSTTKNGDKCNAIVNLGRCEFCIYHIRTEYQKCSAVRSDLQSSFAGRGLTALRNKVLGNNEVFYGGKSYSRIPAKTSKKTEQKDLKRLAALNGQIPSVSPTTKIFNGKKQNATRLDISYSQKAKDIALLKKLTGDKRIENTEIAPSTPTTLKESKTQALNVIAKLKDKAQNNTDKNMLIACNQNDKTNNTKLQSHDLNLTAPTIKTLSKSENIIDLNAPIPKRQVDRAKLNALKWIQKNGPIKKVDPMSTKGTGQKRLMKNCENSEPKRQKVESNPYVSERFKKLMEATSSHVDLLKQKDNEEQDKYFEKLEMKERIEEKMMSTYKIQCKAVKCLTCKYTSFSAADKCKTEKHPLKVFDAMKRFFKCGDCGNRTCCLGIIPLHICKNCGSSKWERTSMLKEKKVVGTHVLSIRGGEQEFMNANISNGNLDLLVPD